MSRILLVEDEPDLVLGLTDALEEEGHEVRAAPTAAEALALAASEDPALCVLDLMLPDRDGIELCGALRRARPSLPILILTARSQEQDKLRGFAAGADDYVTKPFSVAELLARVRALLRRAPQEAPTRFRVGSAEVDGGAMLVRRGAASFDLTQHEWRLLSFLYARAGQVVSRDEVLDEVWGRETFPTPRTVDNFVVRLRKKIEEDPSSPVHILTAYGLGYKLLP